MRVWDLGLGAEAQCGFPGKAFPPGHVWEHNRVTPESLLGDCCPVNALYEVL